MPQKFPVAAKTLHTADTPHSAHKLQTGGLELRSSCMCCAARGLGRNTAASLPLCV